MSRKHNTKHHRATGGYDRRLSGRGVTAAQAKMADPVLEDRKRASASR